MRLSTRAQYAVRAMVDLSLYSNGSPVSLKEIADREDISLNYLEQLFFRLKKGNIVTSVRGPGGGYLLARESSSIKLGEIVTLVEDRLAPLACMEMTKQGCHKETVCVTHNVWTLLAEKIRGFLDSITLEDLTHEARQRMTPAESLGGG